MNGMAVNETERIGVEHKSGEERCLAWQANRLTGQSLNNPEYLDQPGAAGKGKEVRSTAGLGTD